MMIRFAFWPALATATLAGCAGQVSRHPMPDQLRGRALVPGMPADISISTLTMYRAVGDLYRIYFVTQGHGFDFSLAFIPDDVAVPPASAIEGFERGYMAALCGYSLSRAGYPWRTTPPD